MSQQPAKALSFGDRIHIAFSLAFGLGLSPVMPGTCGSVPGVFVGMLVHHLAYGDDAVARPLQIAIALALLLAITLFSWWSIHHTEAALGIHDDQRIVIDEVAGQAITVAFLPQTWPWLLAAFVLFRLLDMTKPWIIGKIDRDVKGALGTLGDDVLAGVVAAAALVIAHLWI